LRVRLFVKGTVVCSNSEGSERIITCECGSDSSTECLVVFNKLSHYITRERNLLVG